MKKGLLILCLAICILFTVSSACASDVNDTAIASEDTTQMELSQDNEIAADNLKTSEENSIVQTENEETLSTESGPEILGAGEGNYTDLRNDIANGGNLTKSIYRYCEGDGDTIEITTQDIVINGNGAVIDMNGSTDMWAFYVSASSVTIKNLTIKNAKYSGNYGGAIYFSRFGTVSNCNFVNNRASSNGGAVYFSSTGDVSNCNFTDNTASSQGGAIRFSGSGTVTNCNFAGNTAKWEGGAVYFNSKGNVSNCNFADNHASVSGGAVYFSSSYSAGTVSNCNFTDNTAPVNGGAVYFQSTGNVSNCNFTNNKATGDSSYGGAVYFSSTGTVINCNFTNNSASNFFGNTAKSKGGAVYFSSTGAVSNCNFNNNTANDDYTGYTYGGAVYFSSTGAVLNCNFTDNTATYEGGAIRMYSGTVSNCNFADNHASVNGGAVYFQSTGNVSNCNFTRNTANYGGAVYFNSNGNVSNCNFTGNTAKWDGGAVYFNSNGNVSNCNFVNNTAKMGNAIYIGGGGSISNCDFTKNPITKGAIHSVEGATTFSNNIIDVNDVLDDKNFTDIQKLIDDATSGDTIVINGLYTGFGIPILINKPNLTLIGQNNATLDAKGLSKILYVDAKNITIKNIQFTNGFATKGGAVFFDFGSTGTVSNCNFINNKASTYGGAIYIYSQSNITLCNFTNCHTDSVNTSKEGAIYDMRGNSIITNCIFNDIKSADDGNTTPSTPSQNTNPTNTQTTTTKTTKTTLTLKKVKIKKSAKKLVISATIKINGKVKKGLKVKFNFNKKTYTAKTDKKGVAKITIKKSVLKKLKAGKKVTYSATYNKTTKKYTVKIQK